VKLFIFILFYIFFTFSIIGYGILLRKFVGQSSTYCIGYSGIYGIFFITFVSYFINYFIPISASLNILIHFFGFILFFYFYKKKFKVSKNELLLLFIVILFSFLFILSAKPHDDFSYYHFPYINMLNNDSLQIGIGNFNHGFRTHSSIFYFSSTFYLPLINYELIHLGSSFFLIFVNLILLKKLTIDKNNYSKFILILSVLSFALLNIFFYRIGEHGVDRSAQILIMLLVVEMLFIFNFKKINLNNITNLIILIILAASLKPIYLIYFLFFFLFIYYSRKKLTLILEVIKSKIFLLSTVFILFVISVNFLNSGCLIYPLTFVCFDHFTWSIPIDQVNHMNQHYNLWSKAGITPNFRIVNPEEYLKDFKWVSNWFDLYFFNKVSDYLLGLLVLLLFVFLILFKSNKNKFTSIKFLPVYLLIVILFLEWFFHHPALRYGGYHLIALLFFIPFSIYLSGKTFNNKKLYGRIFLTIILVLAIFVVRNVQRISKEHKIYNYNPLFSPSYNKQFENYSIYSSMIDAKNCNKNNCSKGKVISKKIINKFIFFVNK